MSAYISMPQTSIADAMLMQVKGQEAREHMTSLKPGDIIEFRSKLGGGSAWSGEPWIVESLNLMSLQLTIRSPFNKPEALYLVSYEVRLLERGKGVLP